MNLEIETIEQFTPLIEEDNPAYKARYQVYYGGRGGRKSWEVARSILIRAMRSKMLVLCTREMQNSITDSVHRLLSDQIEKIGMGYFYDIQKTTIKGLNGSEFIFKGLNGLTIDSIKSLEGVDICWVEEAQSVSDKSWQILIPTIRKNGSQIFITFNPDLPDDPVYTRFVLNTPPNTYVEKVSYMDNPDCPDVLIEEAEYLKRVDYDAYAHIWLGEVRQHSEAQVFKGKYKIEGFEVDDTFGSPLNGADWGFSVDPTVTTRSYIKDKTLYIRYESYKIGCEIDDTPKLFEKIPDVKNYVIRADNARPEMVSYMKRAGFRIVSADKWPGCVEDRVSFMRNFEMIVVHPECKHTAEEMRLYSYKVDKRTGDVLPELVKKHDHCFVGNTKIITEKGLKNICDINIHDLVLTSKGFKRVIKRYNNGLQPVNNYLIQFDTFSLSLHCTSDHLIKTTQGWKTISELQSGHQVYLSKNLMGKHINYIPKNDIFQEAQKECILQFGSISMIKFLKHMKYITRTKIHGIIELKILKLKRSRHIGGNMLKSVILKIRNGLINFIQPELSLQSYGINQKKEGNGIQIMLKKPTLNENTEHLYVMSVGKNTRQDIREIQNTVIQTVKRKHCETGESQNVYDLHIEDVHEYFANGLLVHNCIDSIGYSLTPMIKHKVTNFQSY